MTATMPHRRDSAPALALAILAAFCVSAKGGAVTLTWDAYPTADRITIYKWFAPGFSELAHTSDDQITLNLTGDNRLVASATVAGVESDFSGELLVSVPAPPVNFRIIIQTADSAGGPWTDTQYAITTTEADWQRFFRLRIEPL